MATVREVVLPHHKKEDGTFNVKIRVTHNRKSSYIDTTHFIGVKQLRKDHTIKDTFILDLINPILKSYREKISDLGIKISYFDSKSLADYLESGGQVKAEDINVIKFGREQIKRLEIAKREASAADMKKVVNSLVDYCKKEVLPITDIRAKFLEEYAEYLKKPRTMTRLDQYQKPVIRNTKGLGKTALHNHLRDLRILFNNIVDFYNDEDMGIVIINHYPFNKFKIGKPAKNIKPKLDIKQVRCIMKTTVPANSRIELARDLAMLSFFLCGMNAADLYRLSLAEKNKSTRIDYNRKKTMLKREDGAFMSVHIPEIAMQSYQKYAGRLQLRYATAQGLDAAIAKGMIGLRKLVNIPNLGFYDLRHAFADIARNVLYFDKDDVAEALNHIDQNNRVTDIYLSRSWVIIDCLQNSMIEYLLNNKKPKKYM